MSMTFSGSGTITGLVAGGLPDGTVTPSDLTTGHPTWDSSGNLGIGGASLSSTRLHVVSNGASGPITNSIRTAYFGEPTYSAGYGNGITLGYNTSTNRGMFWGSDYNGNGFEWGTFNGANWGTRMTLDSSGNLQFNSGYGSVATAYGCRAWVNFNGTGTIT